MQEACAYLKESRKKRNQQHIVEVRKNNGDDGFITGFTQKELTKIDRADKKGTATGQKGAGQKGKKASYNKVWRHHNVPLPK